MKILSRHNARFFFSFENFDCYFYLSFEIVFWNYFVRIFCSLVSLAQEWDKMLELSGSFLSCLKSRNFWKYYLPHEKWYELNMIFLVIYSLFECLPWKYDLSSTQPHFRTKKLLELLHFSHLCQPKKLYPPCFWKYYYLIVIFWNFSFSHTQSIQSLKIVLIDIVNSFHLNFTSFLFKCTLYIILLLPSLFPLSM